MCVTFGLLTAHFVRTASCSEWSLICMCQCPPGLPFLCWPFLCWPLFRQIRETLQISICMTRHFLHCIFARTCTRGPHGHLTVLGMLLRPCQLCLGGPGAYRMQSGTQTQDQSAERPSGTGAGCFLCKVWVKGLEGWTAGAV